MKRTFCLIMAIVIALAMCGCTKRKIKANDIEGVKALLEEKGFYDEKNMMQFTYEGSQAFGGVMTNSWSLFFYDFDGDEDSAEKIADVMTSEIEMTAERSGKNYKVEECNGTPNYGIYVRVEDTFIMIVGKNEEQDDIKQLAGELGYYA